MVIALKQQDKAPLPVPSAGWDEVWPVTEVTDKLRVAAGRVEIGGGHHGLGVEVAALDQPANRAREGGLLARVREPSAVARHLLRDRTHIVNAVLKPEAVSEPIAALTRPHVGQDCGLQSTEPSAHDANL
jgi:hypothetical protein